MYPRTFGLAELARYQRRWQRLLGASRRKSPERPRGRLREVEDFGPNPGNLRMLAFVPPNLPAGAPLVVVLHGCQQNAHLYDSGTGWSALAIKRRFAVLFPEQREDNNERLCFNWFQPEDVARTGGELASIDGMIDWMLSRHRLNPEKVFATGLSAGGAMAAALLTVLPHRFAAGAIVAGVPYGAAQSVGEALHAMFHARRRSPDAWAKLAKAGSGHDGPWPRISIWQGDADETVVPGNAQELEKQWLALHGLEGQPPALDMEDGHPRRRWKDARGRVAVETRQIAGLGHGTPIAARHAGAGGQLAMRFGKPSAYVLDANLPSTWRIAQFWGLLPQGRGQVAKPAPSPRLANRPVAKAAAKPASRNAGRAAPKTLAQSTVKAASKAVGKPRRKTARSAASALFDPGIGLRLAMSTLRGFLRPKRRR
jgi:poly(hydroxyalkanoate) depolymerase family esterase